ncbi:MAG: SDR family NAD(P)-dependent oxidoreductase, partial [Verrucomicrobia bacterium]|nr:SDR family NAD(P)-dependent oxidoreductase [Verrucomicrobiota bacterium]
MAGETTPVVLITGCSSGIGRAAAIHMRDLGWRVFPTARKTEDLEGLRADGFTPLELDIASPDSISACVAALCEQSHGRIDGLVNNAGFGQPGALEDLSRDAMRRQFEVNVFGLQELTNRILPIMIKQNGGRIVHISSVVGRVALPFMGIYSASKFAVEAMTDAQRVELMGTGVRISLVEPGPIVTRFSKNAVQATQGDFKVKGSRFEGLYEKELKNREESRKEKPFALPPPTPAPKIAPPPPPPPPPPRGRPAPPPPP